MSKNTLYKISRLLLAAAPIMALGIRSLVLAGEPKLPNKFKKQ